MLFLISIVFLSPQNYLLKAAPVTFKLTTEPTSLKSSGVKICSPSNTLRIGPWFGKMLFFSLCSVEKYKLLSGSQYFTFTKVAPDRGTRMLNLY